MLFYYNRMNLVSHFEEHGGMFYYITVMIVALMAGLGYSAQAVA